MASGEFLHFFPTPKILRMPTAGLDISDDAIRFIELHSDRGSFRLQKYDCQQLPSGVIQNGTIHDKEKLITALKRIRETNDLKFVRVSLPEEKSYLYHATVPYISNDNEMRESVSFTIEENAPLSADEVVFDYDVIAEDSVNESDEVDIVVSVLPVDVVENYLDLIKKSGLQPLSLMVESQAVAKAIVPQDNPNAHLVVNIRGKKTAAYIVYKNTVHFTSAFSTQGGSVSDPVFTTFTQSQEGESENNKDQNKEKPSATQKGKKPDKANQELTEQQGQSIATEVQRVLSYWHSHIIGSQDKGRITKILLCGNYADNQKFKQVLSSELRINVETANVWVNALEIRDDVPPISIEESFHYAAAIGLALPHYV